MGSDTKAARSAVGNAPQCAELILEIECDFVNGYVLRDGSRTADRAAAERDRLEDLALRRDECAAAAAQLLRLPVEDRPDARATPARLDAVRDLVTLGVLPPGIESVTACEPPIDDLTWALVKPLVEHVEPEAEQFFCWVASLEDESGTPHPLPAGYDPLRENGDEPSKDAVDALLAALELRGLRRVASEIVYEHDDEGWSELATYRWRLAPADDR